MRHASVLLLSVTLLALIGEGGSASAATTLELSAEGAALEVGTPIATSSSGMIIQTSAGNITCEESVMEGTVTANNSTKDSLQFTNALFRQQPAPQPPRCDSTLALGEPSVTAGGLPWSLDLRKKANGKFRGSKKPRVTLAFPKATCVMEGSSAQVTFNLPPGEEAVPLELSLSGLGLKLVKGSGTGCPKSGTLEEPGIAVSDQAQTRDKPINVKNTKRPKK